MPTNKEQLEALKKLSKEQAPTLTKSGADIVADSVETSLYLKRSYVEWRRELAWQCGVFVFGEQYIAKRFYQINYKFCGQDTAKEIVTDNLFAILRHRYFKKINDEIDDKIREIVKNFTTNLASTLKRISFEKDDDCEIVNRIPDWCVAFKNGVYDFKNDTWLFMYQIDTVEELSNRIYSYDQRYIIQWYMNFDFEPIGINIMETPLPDFVEMMKELEEPYRWVGNNEEGYKEKNICFELMYNMAHDVTNEFSMDKFVHLCEVIGYLMNVSFIQAFVMLIGSGRNGKNSLIDGCFSHKVVPMPTNNSLIDIETDKFVTGTLENKFQNIFLETDEKGTSTNSSMRLKQLTGSELQTAEKKGVDKVSTYINCKYLFSANEQEKLKFGDISDGFRRRINMYEVFYQFVPSIEKLKKKSMSYYYTPFKQDLSDVKENLNNLVIFVYLALYGIKSATKGFTKGFEFSRTDWNDTYSDIDLDLRDKINSITLTRITKYMKSNAAVWSNCQKLFYDSGIKNENNKPVLLYKSPTLLEFGHEEKYDSMYKMLTNVDSALEYFAEYDVYISMQELQILTGDTTITHPTFVANFKKLFPDAKIMRMSNSKNYVLINFDNDKLKVRRK